MRLLIAFPLLLLFGITSCDDPTQLREPPPPASELTLFVALDPSESVQWVHVSPTDPARALELVTARVFQDGHRVAEATGGLRPDDEQSRCDILYGTDHPRATGASVCLPLPLWPQELVRYRLEVSAAGWQTAVAETRIPGPFMMEYRSSGGGLARVSWTTSEEAATYIVSSQSTGCHPEEGCQRGWAIATEELSAEVPELAPGDGSVIVGVAALDQPLHEYLTSGATGEYFVVPPLSNVENGGGVFGSWVRRSFRDGKRVPPPEPGSWSVHSVDDVARNLDWIVADDDTADRLWGITRFSYPSEHKLAKSEDGGLSWEVVVSAGVGERGFARGGRDTVWAGVGRELWRSIDGGEQWSAVGVFRAPIRLLSVGERSGLLYVALVENDPSGGLVFRSRTDGTFEQLNVPFPGGSPARVGWAIETDGALLVAGWSRHRSPPEHFIWRSVDGGILWTDATGPFGNVQAMAASSDGVYAINASGGSSPGIYRTQDAGLTWQRQADDDGYRTLLSVDGQPPRIFLARPVFLAKTADIPGGVGLLQSGGGGIAGLGLTGVSVTALAQSSGYLFATAPDRGVFRLALDEAVP